jgi:hypothetical protein
VSVDYKNDQKPSEKASEGIKSPWR